MYEGSLTPNVIIVAENYGDNDGDDDDVNLIC